MANTADTLGEAATLDGLVDGTLTRLEDDRCVRLGANVLREHTNIESVKLPSCVRLMDRCLFNCTSLETVDILGGGTISKTAFNGSRKLKHLIMRGSTMSSPSGTELFLDETLIGSRRGAVYVPDDLIGRYKGSSLWKNLTIVPLSSYPLANFETVSDTWDQIIAASANGTYSSKYEVGDIKAMTIDGDEYYFVLVAMDSDILASDVTETAPMTWVMCKILYGSTHRMNATNTTSGGWASSELRSWLSETVLPLLPSSVQSAIKEVRKYSGTYDSSTVKDGCVTSDRLWIPNTREVNLNTQWTTQGPTYYNNYYSGQNTTARMESTAGGAHQSWWLRDVRNGTQFNCINSSGAVNNTTASTSNMRVCLGFCL